ncbi:DUF2264 domain-containing protein [Streptomyces sp. NA04227]|uniref:DUF2264 domain-containing protein n=1 Tax=Streptomyces sp. NA04227 TaxID=2742136 RepID=UPI0015909F67|nr:DUF2264 domain-containing protein [Streptomyces sp. NA04227]QKW10394.1 DUF2264 domain-containing protein [Streptomyces sp. NA04227]
MSVPPHLLLPPPDRVLSSRTGWTRAHWEALADRMLAGVAPYATPGGAQYRLPGRHSWSGVQVDGLEGFARTFLLAACRIAGAGESADAALVERYARGLAAGTDARSGESWPQLTDCSQQMVEAASLAVALHETRPWIWDRLDSAVQERVADWLSGFLGARTWDNNWRLFQVVCEQFLASVGAPHRAEDIEGGLDRIEDWYRGDGWYTDGDGRNFDYYIGWALHLYPLLWARIAGEGNDGGRAATYRERLRLFLTDYPRFFGADGAPVHQGRSLTYRVAALAPVWMGALADCTPLAPGLTRRLASGTARHFAERGVPDTRGLLTLGWYEEFLPTTQPYSGPASPYWASKGFLGLLLPDTHPVWTEHELPLPIEELDEDGESRGRARWPRQCTTLTAPGWLLHATRHDGIVRLLNHGSDHNPPQPDGADPADGTEDPHYTKLAYSSATAPDSAPHAHARGIDNHLALLAADGTPTRRRRIHPLRCADGVAASWYAARLPGEAEGDGENGDRAGATCRIETTSVPHGPWEIRVHRVEAPQGYEVREGGWSVAATETPVGTTGPGWATVRTADGLTSTLVALHGWGSHPDARIARDVAANAFGPHSAVPCLHRDAHPGGTAVYVSLVALGREPVHPGALAEAVRVSVTEVGAVGLEFLDGRVVTV